VSGIQVFSNFHNALTASEVSLGCPHCEGRFFVEIPWLIRQATDPVGWGKRHALIKAAVDEHRVVCPKAAAEAYRVVEITYPRKP
jgi:hypothetical protein